MQTHFSLPHSFSLNAAHNKGLIFDDMWKDSLSDEYLIPEATDAPYDAFHVNNMEYVDVKLMPKKKKNYDSSYVYISHNEFLFGKQHNTTFVVYAEEDDCIRHVVTFSFSHAKELGAITLFDTGKQVLCKETNKLEPPWRIEVSRILQKDTPVP